MPQPRRHHLLTTAIVAVAVFLLVACGNDSNDDADTTSDTTTTTTPNTPTTGPDETTATTQPSDDPSALPENPETPEDWVAILDDLLQRQVDLTSDPPSHDLTDVYSPLCDCYEDRRSFFEDYLLANNYSMESGGPYTVHAIKLQPLELDDFPDVEGVDIMPMTARIEGGGSRVVDEAGQEVGEYIEGSIGCVALTVRSDDHGPYVFSAWRGLEGCPDDWDWERPE